jgi:dienelactone hydrolase
VRDLPARRAAIATIAAGAGVAGATVCDGPQPWPLVRALVVVGLSCGMAAATLRLSTRSAAALQTLAGFVAIVVGVGIGIPHLLETGLSVEATGGCVALAVGVGLLIAGVIGLLRGARWWHTVLAVPSVAVVAIVAGTPLSFALMATNSPPLSLGSRSPADVGLAYDDVELTTEDGVRLDAWYIPSTNGAAVVLLGGSGTTRDGEVDRAAVLARHGFGVLLLDARGHGGSAGEAMLLGWFGERDVQPAIDFLATRPDVRDGRIGVVGMSMGGQQAVAAAGADHRIRAVVADGVVGRHASENKAQNPIDRLMGNLMMVATDVMTSAPHPTPLRDAVQDAAPNRVLVIAGATVWAETDFAEKLHRASPTSVELWFAPDSGHTEAFAKHPAEWERRVTDFLRDTLLY